MTWVQSNLIGMPMFGPDGKEWGEVTAVLADPETNRPQFIEFRCPSLLGMQGQKYAVPIQSAVVTERGVEVSLPWDAVVHEPLPEDVLEVADALGFAFGNSGWSDGPAILPDKARAVVDDLEDFFVKLLAELRAWKTRSSAPKLP